LLDYVQNKAAKRIQAASRAKLVAQDYQPAIMEVRSENAYEEARKEASDMLENWFRKNAAKTLQQTLRNKLKQNKALQITDNLEKVNAAQKISAITKAKLQSNKNILGNSLIEPSASPTLSNEKQSLFDDAPVVPVTPVTPEKRQQARSVLQGFGRQRKEAQENQQKEDAVSKLKEALKNREAIKEAKAKSSMVQAQFETYKQQPSFDPTKKNLADKTRKAGLF
jgi:hypothetical protein